MKYRENREPQKSQNVTRGENRIFTPTKVRVGDSGLKVQSWKFRSEFQGRKFRVGRVSEGISVLDVQVWTSRVGYVQDGSSLV